MPRNSQYGRWRRAVMQATLWLVFAGTLALAGYVSHRRTRAGASDLDQPVAFGRLLVRLPKGWEYETKPAGGSGPQTLLAQEYDEESRKPREIQITQEQQTGRKKGPQFYLESTLKFERVRAEPFEFLGARGVVVAWRGLPEEFLDLGVDLEEKVPEPGLYACTVLKDGLTVTLQVRGRGAYGPSNMRLLRLVADNLKLSDGPATAPAAVPTR